MITSVVGCFGSDASRCLALAHADRSCEVWAPQLNGNDEAESLPLSLKWKKTLGEPILRLLEIPSSPIGDDACWPPGSGDHKHVLRPWYTYGNGSNYISFLLMFWLPIILQ